MTEKRVQLDAEEQNRLFQEAKAGGEAHNDADHDSGDESTDETGVVHRGIPNGDEPETPSDGTC